MGLEFRVWEVKSLREARLESGTWKAGGSVRSWGCRVRELCG